MTTPPTPPGMVAAVLVRAGMSLAWAKACAQALSNCGVNPENFGTYKDRAAAEKDARDEMGASRRTLAGLDKHGPEKFCEGNSQSGHVAQNAFFQGDRGDPCSNVKPEGGDGGGYGYDMEKALCMDHLGSSTVPGTPHYEITRREAEFAKTLPDGARVTTDTMEKSVRGTAEIAVAGSQARLDDPDVGDLTKKRLAQAEKYKTAQDRLADELPKAKEGALGQPGTLGHVAGAKGKAAKGADAGGVDEDQQKAMDCIVAAWKASMDQMRKDAIEQNSSEAKAKKQELDDHNRKNPKKKVDKYEDIPDKDRKDADKRVADAVKKREKELKDMGAGTAGAAKNPPAKDDCREFQANWLKQHQDAKGSLPPMAGRKPGERTAGPAGSAPPAKSRE